ncbi:glycoside hydrolase [Clostridium sp. 1001271B_151109_B4]|uniref:glycoside hydrolase n=1 Tax=Clostridium sp. 1001271B_151109_B4 TaxID=2787148 RepID=UPI0018AB4FCA|nr:glycoside hydrolase [Clostridium sp. 1001271B_151109_B4]
MNYKFNSKKDYIKVIRGTIEGVILLGLLVLVIKTLFSTTSYVEYDVTTEKKDENGFVALSYFGTNRTGSNTVISTEHLEEHLKTLYENGYVTITQQDIIDYYKHGKDLPNKALFLMFEDGYRGTAIFAQKIMEKYNFKATILTYPEKFDNKDPKFLVPKDLLELEESTYWELGTNGYRLSYINVFDKNDEYVGELNSLEYTEMMDKLARNYNHYLMDYIRDEKGIPKETYTQMKTRITTDYELLKERYLDGIGYVPKLHVLMHANTGMFGNNNNVSKVNEKNIRELFDINYNREGYSYNNEENNIYDLTRMQPQPYWYPNHLLMRIKDDTNEDIKFEYGDEDRGKYWEDLKGATEYRGDVIALTSLSKDSGLIKLKDSENYKNVNLNTILTGNMIGSQAVYLRADEDMQNYIKVQIINNILYVYQCVNGSEVTLYEKELPISDEYADKDIQINTPATRNLQIKLNGNTVEVVVDEVIVNCNTEVIDSGYIYLESAWGDYGYSQRNLVDDVYDGVFEKLYVIDSDTDEILYDNRYKGFEKIANVAKNIWLNIVNWFIETL